MYNVKPSYSSSGRGVPTICNISSHKLYIFGRYLYENIWNEKQQTLPLISLPVYIQHVDNNLLFKQLKLWLFPTKFPK